MSRRMGMVIGIRRECIADYKALHADAWPEIIENLAKANITDYSIFIHEPDCLLFSYWVYTGTDFDADMKRLASNPANERWRAICGPMQTPLDSRAEGEWWAQMEEIYHVD